MGALVHKWTEERVESQEYAMRSREDARMRRCQRHAMRSALADNAQQTHAVACVLAVHWLLFPLGFSVCALVFSRTATALLGTCSLA